MTLNLNVATINDVAKELNVPKSTMYSWKRNGNIPKECFIKIGGSIFVIIPKITEFFNIGATTNDNI